MTDKPAGPTGQSAPRTPIRDRLPDNERALDLTLKAVDEIDGFTVLGWTDASITDDDWEILRTDIYRDPDRPNFIEDEVLLIAIRPPYGCSIEDVLGK